MHERNPLLIVCGALDTVAPHGLAAAQPHALLKTCADCGHLPHIENAVRFNAEVLSFIDSIP